MGLLDKMKSMKNAITGGAASVFVDTEHVKIGEPFTVTVRAQAKDADVKYSRVYLKIQGIERVEVPDADVQYDDNGNTTRKREIVRAQATTLQLERSVAEGGVLGANESAEWTLEVDLPQGSAPQYRGKYSEHSYRMLAALDCFGNDPDSGWQKLRVS